jgi:syntaxin 1B/2/3
MSADLLGVVRGGGEGRGGRERRGGRSLPPPDLEAGPAEDEDAPPPQQEAGAMGTFFAEVSTIKALLEAIRRGLHRLEAANDESKTATKASRIADIRDRMEKDVDEVGKKAREAKMRLEQLEKSNEEARGKKGSGAGSSQDRTRTSITLSLHKKLRDLMGSFQELRGKFKAEYKEVVERRYYAIYGKKARCVAFCAARAAPARAPCADGPGAPLRAGGRDGDRPDD